MPPGHVSRLKCDLRATVTLGATCAAELGLPLGFGPGMVLHEQQKAELGTYKLQTGFLSCGLIVSLSNSHKLYRHTIFNIFATIVFPN